MINGDSNCYINMSQAISGDMVSSAHEASSAALEIHTNSFLYHLSLLKEKVHQVQSLASIFVSPDDHDHSRYLGSTATIAMPTMATLIQEIIVTASSLMFSCQKMALGSNSSSTNDNTDHILQDRGMKLMDNSLTDQLGCDNSHLVSQTGDVIRQQCFYSKERLINWYDDNRPINSLLGSRVQEPLIHSYVGTNSLQIQKLKDPASVDRCTISGCENYNNCKGNDNQSFINGGNNNVEHQNNFNEKNDGSLRNLSPREYDVFELDAADLLAKYTHYCQVCGKGFKRDANLRMHMRAHGDEYKSNAALSNPMKNNNGDSKGDNTESSKLPRKYSCPQEGCRWNKKHAKFQPLKSMICVKNHYKRSHCPKMYVCNRCNRKQFSLLSDLRTHEKHCGDLKWQCSCGTTFSRKDKLMGHLTLFLGHTPLIPMGNA